VRIVAAIGGEILQVLGEDELHMPAPTGYGAILEADEASNAALLGQLRQSTDAWRLLGGALYRDGQPVAINPESAATTERRQALALVQTLKEYNARANPTAAQTVAAVKANNRLTLILGRLLLREMAGE
jgi:hypothetical protein